MADRDDDEVFRHKMYLMQGKIIFIIDIIKGSFKLPHGMW